MKATEVMLNDVKDCIARIYADDYYINRWEHVKHKKPLEECSKDELLEPFQDFWEALPDSSNIRCGPFWAVCDLAEQYCFGEDE